MIIKFQNLENYLKDVSNLLGNADKLLIPENYEDLQQYLISIKNTNEKLNISGGRTSTTGSASPKSGTVISTEKLNKIVKYDESTKIVTVQSGVVLSDLLEYLKDRGRYLYYKPTEINSFVGGNISTNCSGATSFKFGSVRNYVKSLKVLLPGGDIIILKRGERVHDKISSILEKHTVAIKNENYKLLNIKNSTGPLSHNNFEPIDLFIGSEGIFGIILEAELKTDSFIEDKFAMLIFFDDNTNMLNFVDIIRAKSKSNESELDLNLIEFFDKHCLEILEAKFPQIPHSAQSAIWIEQGISDNYEVLLDNLFKEISNFTNLANQTIYAESPEDHRNLSEIRHSIPVKTDEIIVQNKTEKISTDTAVPIQRFKDYFSYMMDLAEESGIEYICFGHIGDCHLHLNYFPKNNEEINKANNIYGNYMRKAIELKGTISAEHGIGKLKKKYLKEMHGEQYIEDLRKLKNIIDQNQKLNIGNLFD